MAKRSTPLSHGETRPTRKRRGSEKPRSPPRTRRADVEQWAVNKAVHYNEWANFGKTDFEPVVAAFRELLDCFPCSDCDSWLYVTPRQFRSPAMSHCSQHEPKNQTKVEPRRNCRLELIEPGERSRHRQRLREYSPSGNRRAACMCSCRETAPRYCSLRRRWASSSCYVLRLASQPNTALNPFRPDFPAASGISTRPWVLVSSNRIAASSAAGLRCMYRCVRLD